MTNLKKTLAKGALGTVAAGAMALATASPAMADDRRDKGIDAGDIVAGAVIIGGIAALAGAFDGDDHKRGYRDRRYRDRDYNRGYSHRYSRRGERRAINRCTRAAERQAMRFGGYRFAEVTRIRDVDRTRYGFKVKGRIIVEDGRRYGRRGADRGKFTCFLDGRGRPQVDFDNIRRLR